MCGILTTEGTYIVPYKACSLVSINYLGAVTLGTAALQDMFTECSCWSHAHAVAVAVIVFAMHCVCSSSALLDAGPNWGPFRQTVHGRLKTDSQSACPSFPVVKHTAFYFQKPPEKVFKNSAFSNMK